MPKLSPTMEEGQISRWLKAEGEEIEANETIAEVDTDKATMEMTSLEAGTLLKILVPAGENARLGQTIGIIGAKGEDFSALLDDSASNAASNGGSGANVTSEDRARRESEVEDIPKDTKPPGTAGSDAKSAGAGAGGGGTASAAPAQEGSVSETAGRSYDYQRPQAVEQAQSQQQQTASQPQSGGNGGDTSGGRMIVSPIAARMAAENGVDLKSVKGSGPNGRIIKRDIEAAMQGGQPSAASSAQPEEQPQTQTAPTPGFAQTSEIQNASGFREENTSKMRQVIAQRLAQSIGPIPTFYLTVEIEMDAALEFRKQINASVKEDEKVSVNDVIVKVAAQALLKHPFVNSSYQDKTIRFYEDADIGVAVAIEDGLITPVVRGANRKGVTEISKEIKEMAARAREKKLQPEEYTGATFSISNLGMFGIKEFTAIINPPEAAIIAVGAAAPTVVVRNGEIVTRNIMNVTMSCDHRVIDGATGAKFLQTFKQMLENPILMLM
ncbi:MAG: pyruvate dehydrogenase complex dihydrolipoamide acetyltransferase [Acidobacteriota bacterium]|nr:pyruvate dehydrogenase complex dihydrolipoamide acetyltransferase [Acidobacteriota bacterium]